MFFGIFKFIIFKFLSSCVAGRVTLGNKANSQPALTSGEGIEYVGYMGNLKTKVFIFFLCYFFN